MPLFKKSSEKSRKDNIKFLQGLSSTCDLCLQYSQKTEHHDRMMLLSDEVKYFLPFQNEDITRIDQTIKKVLDDLKILLYTNRDPYRVEQKLGELDRLIRERSSKE